MKSCKFQKFKLKARVGVVDLEGAVGIGSYIDKRKYSDYRSYNGADTLVKTIQIGDVNFIVNGRTRSRANYDNGKTIVPSIIRDGNNNLELENVLLDISSYSLSDLPLKGKNRSSILNHTTSYTSGLHLQFLEEFLQ